MTYDFNCIKNASIYAIILNLILPILAKPFATKEEIKPPNGADKLSFKSQIMHMLVHHAQVPITSSIIIVLIVSLSITLAYTFKIIQ